MKTKNVAAAGAIVLASALALTACSSSSNGTSGSSSSPSASASASTTAVDSSLSGTITAGGSSAQANAQQAWTAAFTAQAGGVTINYDKSQGSGGGVTNWLGGTYDFAGTDSALSAAQYTQAAATKPIDVPVYLSGVAIIYHLDGVSDLQLSSDTLAKIFELKITNWNDPAIAKDNPDAKIPAGPITVVTRSDGSGTTANFTTYLKDVQPSIFTQDAGTAWPVPGTSGQQGGSGVVTTVAAGTGTIGYADQSSIAGATAAKIQVGTGTDFVGYSAAGATAAFSAAATTEAQGDGDLTQVLDYSKITDKSAYPIPLLSYDVVATSFKDADQAKLTKAYLTFITSSTGQEVAAKNAGSAPLPDDILADAQKSIDLIK